MATALDHILEYKVNEVAKLKAQHSMASLLANAAQMSTTRGFARRMDDIAAAGENALICELKRKSPSAGEIMPGADPVEIAKEYEAGGAACLSVLTDYPSFGGSLDDLMSIRDAVKLPLLRKEFMIDDIQVAEARASGADAILIILSAVDDSCARSLGDMAVDLGMDVIVEVHDHSELERANALPFPLIGVNNRDLKLMVTDLATTETLAGQLGSGKVLISESGISTPEHIARLRKTGARRFLIGESLMKATVRKQQCTNLRSAV